MCNPINSIIIFKFLFFLEIWQIFLFYLNIVKIFLSPFLKYSVFPRNLFPVMLFFYVIFNISDF